MASDLSPQNEQYLQQVLAGGLFPTREAALDAAVSALREKQEESQPIPSEHRRLVEKALDELDAGLGEAWDVNEEKRLFRERLAERKAARP